MDTTSDLKYVKDKVSGVRDILSKLMFELAKRVTDGKGEERTKNLEIFCLASQEPFSKIANELATITSIIKLMEKDEKKILNSSCMMNI